jgi:hypothetical protein
MLQDMLLAVDGQRFSVGSSTPWSRSRKRGKEPRATKERRARGNQAAICASSLDSRRAPRTRPAPLRALAPRAWHRPQEAHRKAVAGFGHQPQHTPITGDGRRPVSRPRWRTQRPHARLCSIGWPGRLRACASALRRRRRSMWLWRQS